MDNAIRRRRLRYIFLREKGRCFYCNIRITINKSGKNHTLRDATVDHIIPKSLGGLNVRENLVLACRGCNLERGVMPAETFLAMKVNGHD